MKLVASAPRTIHAVRHGFRWFPMMFRHVDGTLLLYVQYTYDAHFGPVLRLRSHDNGRSWIEDEENVPRLIWAHSFADGELFELDTYGFVDTRTLFAGDTMDTCWYYAAWSRPADQGWAQPAKLEYARLRAPAKKHQRFCDMQRTFLTMPTHPWWRLLNIFELGENKALAEEDKLGFPPVPQAFDTGENIRVGGPFITDGVEVDGVLLAVGYAQVEHPTREQWAVFLHESHDRGRTWTERSLVGTSPDTAEGMTESTIVRLKDGRLYVVMRSGYELFHVWSTDMGKTWTNPTPMKLIDSDYVPRRVWPVCKKLDDGTLVLAFGRSGKHLIFDPSGTGTQWQGRLNLHELELSTQAGNGVSPNQRLRGVTETLFARQWDSGDYLFLTPIGPRQMLAGYDVQNYIERPGDPPVSAVRMVTVTLED